MQHSNPGGASEGSSRDADLSPAVKIEIVPEGSNNLDLSPSFDWDSILNPRRGRAFNILRRLAKRIFRASWNRLFRRQYGTNFGMDPDFITERHHNAYGIPWAVGREQFDYLVSRGLESRHRLADLGCGTLRTGIWIIRYLDPECYFGIDRHRKSLEAAAQYEIPLHGLEAKRPRLLNDAGFSLDHFRVSFDWIISLSLFSSLPQEEAPLAMAQVSSSLKPGGRFVVNHGPPLARSVLSSTYQLELVHESDYPCRFLRQGAGWLEFEKRIPESEAGEGAATQAVARDSSS